MEKKRILNIIYSGVGGHGSVWYSLMKGGGLEYWQNYVVFYGIEDVNPDYITFCENNKIQYLFLKKESKVDIINWINLLIFILKNKFKAVICHQASLISPLILIKFFTSIKIIIVEHTPLEIQRSLDKIFKPLIFFCSNKVVYLNDTIFNTFRSNYKFFKSKIVLIPNGIDYHKYVFKEKKLTTENFKIGMASRMSAQKDFITLIDAFVNINIKNKNTSLLIAGDGAEREKILKHITSKKNTAIQYLGDLKQKELLEFYYDIDIFVLSSFSEGMPMVLLEAMSCGTPVIASNVVGSNFIVKDKENGLLFQCSDTKDLEMKIMELHDKFELSKNLIHNAFHTATQVFSMENMFNQYNSLIQN